MKTHPKPKSPNMLNSIPFNKILHQIGKRKNLSKASVSSSSIVQTQDYSNVSTLSSSTHPKNSSQDQEPQNKKCSIHPEKAGKYISEDLRFFCSKCAVEHAQLGFKVEIFKSSKENKVHQKEFATKNKVREKELKDFLSQLKELKSELKESHSLAIIKGKSISSFLKKQKSQLEHIFNELVSFCLSLKNESMTQLENADEYFSSCYEKLKDEISNYGTEIAYMEEDIEGNFESILEMQAIPYSEIIARYKSKIENYEDTMENLKKSKLSVFKTKISTKRNLEDFLKTFLEEKNNPFFLENQETNVLTKSCNTFRTSFLSFAEMEEEASRNRETLAHSCELKPLTPKLCDSNEKSKAVRLRTTRDGKMKIEGFYSPGIELKHTGDLKKPVFSSPQFKCQGKENLALN